MSEDHFDLNTLQRSTDPGPWKAVYTACLKRAHRRFHHQLPEEDTKEIANNAVKILHEQCVLGTFCGKTLPQFLAYARTIIFNLGLAYIKERKRRRQRDEKLAEAFVNPASEMAAKQRASAYLREQYERTCHALHLLPKPYKELLIARHNYFAENDDATDSEFLVIAAKRTGLTKRHVSVNLHRARGALKNILSRGKSGSTP